MHQHPGPESWWRTCPLWPQTASLLIELLGSSNMPPQADMRAVDPALLDQRAEMEAAIDQAVTASAGHREVRGGAAIMARALPWLVRETAGTGRARRRHGAVAGHPGHGPQPGLWALLHALDRGDGPAAVAEVEASGLTLYWLIRGWVGHARAVELGQRGHTAAAQAFTDAEVAPCDWYRHHARRLVAEAAIRDGWGNPTWWLGEVLVPFAVARHLLGAG